MRFENGRIIHTYGRMPDGSWWEIEKEGDIYCITNIYGDFCAIDDLSVISDIVEGEDMTCLKPYLLRDTGTYSTGWVSPSGKFYGCPVVFHRAYAEIVLEKDEPTLEYAGWLKIGEINHHRYWSSKRSPTEEQLSVLQSFDLTAADEM